MDSLGIHTMTKDKLFNEVFSNDENIKYISEAISDKKTNKSFYRFMADNFYDPRYKYTRKMRDNFILFRY